MAGVEIAGHRDLRGCSCEVGVVEHHDGCLAAEFEVHALERLRSRLGDFHTGAHRTSHRHHRRCRVRHHRAARVAVTAHHVEHTRRQELCRNLGEQRGGCRCRVARLQHDAVARSDGRCELPDGHHHRVVPRCHLRAHADRLATNHRREPLHVFTGALAFEHARRTREETNLVDHGRNLFRRRDRDGLAAVFDFHRDELVFAGFDCVGDAEECKRALARGRFFPHVKAALRGVHRGVDVGLLAVGRGGIDLAGGGVDDVEGLAVGGVNVLALDEVAERFHEVFLARRARVSGAYAVWRACGACALSRTAVPMR